MQTVASRFDLLRGFLIAALYLSVFGCATPTVPPAPAPVTPPAVEAPAAPAPVEAPVLGPVVIEPAPSVQPLGAPGMEHPAPHFALLLPLNSSMFAKAADAVKQGFLAAASRETGGLPVRIYPCIDEKTEVAALYQLALQNGAVAVAGPLTRDGVATLAANRELVTPTLALNTMDEVREDRLYFFGLPAEAEARQSAQRATAAGLLSASIVSTNTPLSKRLAQAFADEWQRSGGILRAEIVYKGDPTPLKELSQDPGNSVFLAAELDKARLLRPYINSMLPVYSTSQVFAGNTRTLTNYDLSDVRFVDMPWMLQPDHPAVMIYPRSAAPLPPELERLYALGIDAYRLLQVLLDQKAASALPLDGVTGKITLTGHMFQREATLATMRQGQGVPIESSSRP
jgi:outer membrane PBP1 activator LpoA protein